MSQILCIRCEGVAEPMREHREVAYGRRKAIFGVRSVTWFSLCEAGLVWATWNIYVLQ